MRGEESRHERIDSVFARSKKQLRLLAFKDGLGRAERTAYEQQLHRWFHGFASRPGNDVKPVETLRDDLLSAAGQYAFEFKEFFRGWKAQQPAATAGTDAGGKWSHPKGMTEGESSREIS
ncbi:MAG: hypothetical protein ACRD1B_08750 [Thermoanaerobaculia bacterium]